ncbi:hypothetical protein GBAR_LOCUS14186, partial [Geodia barretti]
MGVLYFILLSATVERCIKMGQTFRPFLPLHTVSNYSKSPEIKGHQKLSEVLEGNTSISQILSSSERCH